MKKCCELRYLAVSAEMQMFCRPQGDIEKLLSTVARPRTQDQLAVYRQTVPINENWGDKDVEVFK